MCWYCEEQTPIKSQDEDVDAIIEDGYFRVLQTPEGRENSGMEIVDTVAVFKFAYCPKCGRRLDDA